VTIKVQQKIEKLQQKIHGRLEKGGALYRMADQGLGRARPRASKATLFLRFVVCKQDASLLEKTSQDLLRALAQGTKAVPESVLLRHV
jgi:hypothetical protein